MLISFPERSPDPQMIPIQDRGSQSGASDLDQEIIATANRLNKLQRLSTLINQIAAMEKSLAIARGCKDGLVVIPQLVASYYGIQYSAFEGRSRLQSVADARHVAFYLMREMCGYTLHEISSAVGGRDHGTALNGIRKVQDRLSIDPDFRTDITKLHAQCLETMGLAKQPATLPPSCASTNS